MPENLIVATAHGKVTAEDYEGVLMPAVEKIIRAKKKVRLLYHLDRDFTGFTPGAIWDDAKLGLGHLNSYDAVAIVTDVLWVRDAALFFGMFFRCPVRVFHNEEMEEARSWVATALWRKIGDLAEV